MDAIDRILRYDASWKKRLDMQAYLCFVSNGRRRGLLFLAYENEAEALLRHDKEMRYLMGEDSVAKLSSVLSGIDCLEEVMAMYDDSMQVVIVVIIGRDSFLMVDEYSIEETHQWMEHINCIEP